MKINYPAISAALFLAGTIPAQAGLVGYYDFENNVDDQSGNNNHGTIVGLGDDAPTYSSATPSVLTTSTASMSFAANGIVSINDGAGGLNLNANPAFTVAMWVRGDGTTQSDDRIFSEGTPADANPLYNLGTQNAGADGRFDFFFRNGASTGHLYSVAEPFDGNWHHVAVVDVLGVADLYVDGVFDTAFDYSALNPDLGSQNTTIGGILRATQCCNFTGEIDDVYFFDNALTPSQVAGLANGIIPEPSVSLLALAGASLLFFRRRK